MLSNDERILDLAHEIGVMFVNQRHCDLLLAKFVEESKVLKASETELKDKLANSERLREELANSIRAKKIPLSPRNR